MNKDVIKCMMHGINKKGFRRKSGSTKFVEKKKHNNYYGNLDG
jgi:hypothetical protein